MKFKNPIIPGLAPDPSIVFVKGKYYLVNSSFHVFPGIPVYMSEDLQYWSLIDRSLRRLHQPFRPSEREKSHGYWRSLRPTIRHHKDRFYIVCTNAHDKTEGAEHSYDNFILTCPEDEILSSNWSDPIPVDFSGIDPSLFFDPDTGKAFFCGSHRTGPPWNPTCSIRGFEIDVRTGKALTDLTHLWDGHSGKADAEGPHIYKKDGWFYLVTAENSTFEGHQINIARSRNIGGPYESHLANPLLTAENKNTEIKWTGHGDLFQDQAGKWWCVHLGVMEFDSGKRIPLGRETFLTPVRWETDDWPIIEQTMPNFEREVSFEPSDTLSSWERPPLNRLEDLYIRTPRLDNYVLPSNLGNYSLRPQAKSTLLCVRGTTTFVGRRQKSFTSTVSTILKLDSLRNDRAGLCVFKDRLRHASLYVDGTSSKTGFRLASIENGESRTSTVEVGKAIPPATATIHLRVIATAEKYVFMYMFSGEWIFAGEVDSAALTGHDFTSPMFGIFAETELDVSDSLIVFENFQT